MSGAASNSENLLLIVLLVGLAGMLFFRMGSQAPSEVAIGAPRPALSVEGWINQDLEETSLGGKVVLIDFFATWCGPCRAKMPMLVELKDRMVEQDLQVLGLTSERGGESLGVAEYVSTVEGLDWPVGYGAGKVFDALGIRMIPSLAVYGRSGKLAFLGHDLASAEEAVIRELASGQ